MVIDLLLALLAIASGATLVALLGRKLTLVSGIDLTQVPERKEALVKGRLIEQRFTRSLAAGGRTLEQWVRPVGAWLKALERRVSVRLKAIEERYSLPSDPTAVDATRAAKVTQLLNEARAYLEDSLLTEAEQKCIEAISHSQFEGSAYRMLGEVYRQQKDYGHAKEVYEFLRELNAQDPEAYLGLGRVAAAQGEYGAAEAEFAKSLELIDTAAVHLELADVYEQLGRRAQALAACQDALVLDPRNPKYLDRFLTLAIATQRRDLAEDALTMLRTVNPENQKLSEFASQVEALPR